MRKLPPLHALRAFEAAARHLHFADAAEELGLTPTAISHQVRQLEDILGVPLFHRFPRPVRLTAAGEKLFPVLRQALDQIAGTIDQLSVTTAETPLRLSVTMAFASRWLMARLPRLRAETGLKITVEAADLPADLHASDIDMAIRYAGQPDDRAEWHRLVDDDSGLCAGSGDPAAVAGWHHGAALAGLPLEIRLAECAQLAALACPRRRPGIPACCGPDLLRRNPRD